MVPCEANVQRGCKSLPRLLCHPSTTTARQTTVTEAIQQRHTRSPTSHQSSTCSPTQHRTDVLRRWRRILSTMDHHASVRHVLWQAVLHQKFEHPVPDRHPRVMRSTSILTYTLPTMGTGVADLLLDPSPTRAPCLFGPIQV